MPILKELVLQNFQGFRSKTRVRFSESTYMIGINNSGKTSIFNAVRIFFGNLKFEEGHLNQTEYIGKGTGYNRSEISIVFDLKQLKTKALKRKLIAQHGEELAITKILTYRPKSDSVFEEYKIDGKRFSIETLSEEVTKILACIKISYIHPQDSSDLLVQAQEKLKQRLLSNWGRHYTVSQSVNRLDKSWSELREKSNEYLSSHLSESIQRIWPDAVVSVDLPESIQEVVAVSEINIKANQTSPKINLSKQGAGSQSAILYHTHYLLDSDRTLHQGEYHPIWILEEPETFLHQDIVVKVGNLLNSVEWLSNIQMLVSSHSPLLLSTTAQNKMILWNILANNAIEKTIHLEEIIPEDIEYVAKLMGDRNFESYFHAAEFDELIFIEDSKELTITRLKESGVQVTHGLSGIDEVARYLDVISKSPFLIRKKATFIVDSDKGKSKIARYLSRASKANDAGFKKYSVLQNVNIVTLPDNESIEFMFDEFHGYLQYCVGILFTKDLKVAENVPSKFSRDCARLRNKTFESKEKAVEEIKNYDDVKMNFWAKVQHDPLSCSKKKISKLLEIMK